MDKIRRPLFPPLLGPIWPEAQSLLLHAAASGGPFLLPGEAAFPFLCCQPPLTGWSSQPSSSGSLQGTHVGQEQSPVCYSCRRNHATCPALPSISPAHLLLSTGFSLFPLFSLAMVPPLVAGPLFSGGAPHPPPTRSWPELICSNAGEYWLLLNGVGSLKEDSGEHWNAECLWVGLKASSLIGGTSVNVYVPVILRCSLDHVLIFARCPGI